MDADVPHPSKRTEYNHADSVRFLRELLAAYLLKQNKGLATTGVEMLAQQSSSGTASTG